MIRPWQALAIAAVLVSATAARAQHYDVLFYGENGRLATGATDFGPPFELIADVRVFPVMLDIATGGGVTLSPGFTASATPPVGEPLAPDTPISFFAEPVAWLDGRYLSYWSGAGEVDFGDTLDGERIRIIPSGCFGCSSVFVSSVDPGEPSFPLGTTSEIGLLHQHHEFQLRNGVGAEGAPAAGVYLLGLRASFAGLETSEPFFAVFGERVSQGALANAAAWVEAQLVPEPDALASAAATFVALALISRAGFRRAT